MFLRAWDGLSISELLEEVGESIQNSEPVDDLDFATLIKTYRQVMGQAHNNALDLFVK